MSRSSLSIDWSPVLIMLCPTFHCSCWDIIFLRCLFITFTIVHIVINYRLFQVPCNAVWVQSGISGIQIVKFDLAIAGISCLVGRIEFFDVFVENSSGCFWNPKDICRLLNTMLLEFLANVIAHICNKGISRKIRIAYEIA